MFMSLHLRAAEALPGRRQPLEQRREDAMT
jgi:hypothetical protein